MGGRGGFTLKRQDQAAFTARFGQKSLRILRNIAPDGNPRRRAVADHADIPDIGPGIKTEDNTGA